MWLMHEAINCLAWKVTGDEVVVISLESQVLSKLPRFFASAYHLLASSGREKGEGEKKRRR